MDVGFVAGLPAAAVDPEHDRFTGAGFGGMVDVEDVPGMPVFDVRDVASNSLGCVGRGCLSEKSEGGAGEE
jgi:hypothetical protein